MSDPPKQNASTSSSESPAAPSSSKAGSAAKAAEGAPKQNPALRMLGLPNWRPKLPSRNWLIFLTVTTSFTCAILYDRHHKKKNQEKWARVVSQFQNDPLSTKQMPRRLTVYLSAPPGDGLRIAREHFHEYVRPVLEKGGVDWDVMEGRREGDVRAGTAERIRRRRRKLEGVVLDEADREEWGSEEAAKEEAIEAVRELNGVKEYEGVCGDIVIGRNVWKEYVRGIHEGWLGPLKKPKEEESNENQPLTASPDSQDETWQANPPPQTPSTSSDSLELLPDQPSTSSTSNDDASPTDSTPPTSEEQKPADTSSEPEPKPKKVLPPEPYLPSSSSVYTSAPLPASLPDTIGPAALIPYPHILGFLNTRIRLWRFLNRRHLADQIGREVAAAVFASSQPFQHSLDSTLSPTSFAADASPDQDASPTWQAAEPSPARDASAEDELLRALDWEEADWPKSVRKDWSKRWEEDAEKELPRKESVWLDGIVLDPRITARMRRFVLEKGEEERAVRTVGEQEQSE
ncbi:MAG: mitochondrial import inner membrane translocase subunit tim54 [Bathelium mastoideum]|nr:MAG: mitochondrial import inner membrane translocase subunit tim54 [Bathelium mastoideum]